MLIFIEKRAEHFKGITDIGGHHFATGNQEKLPSLPAQRRLAFIIVIFLNNGTAVRKRLAITAANQPLRYPQF
jgi:hypothetical protein